MAPALAQEHPPHLRIGSFAVLIARTTKGRIVGWGVWRVEDRPIDGHEPIATKESAGHGLPISDLPTPLLHQPLQAVAAQLLATTAES
jgi:hypothetical protein